MIILDYRDRRPIYEQIVEKLSELMVCGVLPEDSPLPSVRSLAAELSINPNTVQRAYVELERRGCIYSVKGKGSFVSGTDHLLEAKKLEMINTLRNSFADAVSLGLTRKELEALLSEAFEGGMKHD